jgi:hypothetical protein
VSNMNIASARCLIFVVFLSSPFSVDAQILSGPPRVTLQDQAKVDLMSRLPMFSGVDVSIGSGPLALRHEYIIDNELDFYWGKFRDSFVGQTYFPQTCSIQVSFGSLTECFYGDGTQYPYLPVAENGSTLTNNGNGTYIYKTRDGTSYNVVVPSGGAYGWVTKATYPSGLQISVHYAEPSPGLRRIQSVTQNNGLQLKYNYKSNNTAINDWKIISSIVALNNAIDYCDPNADSCTFSRQWPTAFYTSTDFPAPISGVNALYHYFSITDQGGQVTRFTLDSAWRVIAYKPANSLTDTITYKNCKPHAGGGMFSGASGMDGVDCIFQSGGINTLVYGGVFDATLEGRTWKYNPAFAVAGFYYANSSKHPDGPMMSVSSITPQTPTGPSPSSFGAVNGFDGTDYQYSTSVPNRLMTVTVPGKAPNTFTYDSRGNVIESRLVAMTGSGVADIFVTAGFDAPIKKHVINRTGPRTQMAIRQTILIRQTMVESLQKPVPQ